MRDLGGAYQYARDTIPCVCVKCKCPAAGGDIYSFRYVFEDRACIYYDVPKAASTTIRNKLRPGRFPHVMSLVDPVRPLDRYFKFTVVRDPWARMVSNWKMFTTQPKRRLQLEAMAGRSADAFLEFGAFVDFALRLPNHHWVPQSVYVPDDVDFIGRMEAMDEALSEIARHVPDFDPTNIRRNATTRDGEDHRSHYTTALKDAVGAYYAEDVTRFGYRFQDG